MYCQQYVLCVYASCIRFKVHHHISPADNSSVFLLFYFSLPKEAFLFQVGVISLQNLSFSSVFFPVSRKVPKTGVVFVAVVLLGVWWSCLRNRKTLRFDFLHSYMVCARQCANLCFSITRVVWWLINKKVIFLLSRFIFACRLVLYLYACAVENPEIPGFCVTKNRGLRTDHKRVKKIETLCCSVTQTTGEVDS